MPSSGNTNACPICGHAKTSWSLKCQRCETNRQRYLAAIEHDDEDRRFLRELQGRTLQSLADERHVSRQAVYLQKQKAERRQAFLQQNPLPPLPLAVTTTPPQATPPAALRVRRRRDQDLAVAV
jgi:hypothetical protein